MRFQYSFELPGDQPRTRLTLDFEYDEAVDWYEAKVSREEEVVGYINGYANHGWAPQVNNIWVTESYRRKGVATHMMSAIEEEFGQIPLPATPISDTEEARRFWDNYPVGRGIRSPRKPVG